MRDADVIECKVFNKTPLQAINTAMLMEKNQTLTLYKDNEPILIGGVVPESLKVATIWLLSTEKAFEKPITIGKMAVKWVNYITIPYEKVHNLVWIENKKAINLLILLGFYIHPKVIHVNNRDFYYFVRRNTQ